MWTTRPTFPKPSNSYVLELIFSCLRLHKGETARPLACPSPGDGYSLSGEGQQYISACRPAIPIAP